MPFLEGRLLNEDEHEVYERPTVSSESGSIYEHCVRAIGAEPVDRRARPAADGDRRLERRHEPGRRRRTRRKRVARLVPGVAARGRSPRSPTRAAKPIAPRVYRAHAEHAHRGARRRLGRRMVSPRVFRRRDAARVEGEHRVPDRRDRAVVVGDLRRRHAGACPSGDGVDRSAPGARAGRHHPAADAAVRQDDAQPRLHPGLRAGRPRERRPVHARRAVDGAGARAASATGTAPRRSSG